MKYETTQREAKRIKILKREKKNEYLVWLEHIIHESRKAAGKISWGQIKAGPEYWLRDKNLIL